MEKRIAPNNNLPATHFIEVWKPYELSVHHQLTPLNCLEVDSIDDALSCTKDKGNLHTYAIFRIRENRLQTLHKF